jgi:hypothetical protein
MSDDKSQPFDYNGLFEAGEMLSEELAFYRVPVRDIKEKYGTLRCYTGLGWYSLHSIVYPRYVYSQFPKWLWTFDLFYGSRILYWSGLTYLSTKLHMWTYRRAYAKVVKKFPHLREAILVAADYEELLEGL